jgi:hypothetical protein
VWRLTSHAVVGVSIAITTGELPASIKNEIIVQLLCMTGIGVTVATELAGRPLPTKVGREAKASNRSAKAPTRAK